ncbi:eukaryotic translation initiation factor 3 subunit J [Tribolium castaneum]|uniref:Eukaryotic translation initiation factor 3 subunit J n=1 Tax=Tribolium castaneum TaxID=7070 RepID=D6WTE4_TRICA|nr:PREDICTED: eukaryotic translation initiation factor 3 subunit J [Tribolium castaneum]EFA06707.1 Eukaryotic translation initiation factor 3 subunit J-like Protein [Tribolium castaneum]|eukprot:XP_966955.1 PREDICTED: eukaryotic translation initiation factor 3 subunit J [Tribolium castaneum]
MESWDDDNFEPPSVTPVVASNKWEGEDEDDNVKESWEDEEEEKVEAAPAEEAKPKPKKQSIADKIAEKERKRKEEMERRLREQQEEEISPEEKLRMQKESDLKIALETTFGGDTNSTNISGLDGLTLPTTKEEFQDFTDALSKKLQPLAKSTEYPVFTENLLRNLCATLSSLDIKKIKNTLDNLYLEKQKIEKGEKSKKNKGKGKAKLRLDDGNPLSAYVNDYDDYDDFM